MFLAFQYPQEIPGVSVIQFLRQALSARKGIDLSVLELRLSIMEWMKRSAWTRRFGDRYLNEGFSGGEKKRNEICRWPSSSPSRHPRRDRLGLDIDALRVVATGVARCADRPELGVLLITHYQRILDELTPTGCTSWSTARGRQRGPELARASRREGTTHGADHRGA
jgi:Fe-S cluster assembly ATP-binding protein